MNELTKLVNSSDLTQSELHNLLVSTGVRFTTPSKYSSYAANDAVFDTICDYSCIRGKVLDVLKLSIYTSPKLLKNLNTPVGKEQVNQSIDFILSNLAIALSKVKKITGKQIHTVEYASIVLRNGSSCYKRSMPSYTKTLSYDITKRVVDAMHEAGVIRYCQGFKNPKKLYGEPSRIAPSQELIGWLFEGGCIQAGVIKPRNEPLVALKTGKKGSETISPVEDDEAESTLIRLNEMISAASIDLPLDNYAEYSECYDVTRLGDCKVRRIYRDEVGLHGRFYHRYSGCSKKYRPRLTINGNPTIELDYQASQVHVAYSLLGLHLEDYVCGDPYLPNGLCELPRNVQKDLLTRSFTTSDPVRSVHREHPRYSEEELEQVHAELWKHHQAIATFKHSQAYKEIVVSESRITLRIMRMCTEHGFIVIPIHDSFIVEAHNEDLLRQIMHDAIADCGFTSVPLIRYAH